MSLNTCIVISMMRTAVDTLLLLKPPTHNAPLHHWGHFPSQRA